MSSIRKLIFILIGVTLVYFVLTHPVTRWLHWLTCELEDISVITDDLTDERSHVAVQRLSQLICSILRVAETLAQCSESCH